MSVEKNLFALVGHMVSLTVNQRKSLVALFAELLGPYGVIPPTVLHDVLHEAAKQAGWARVSAAAQHRQQVAAQARKIQRGQDMAHRRVLVACIFKELRLNLRFKPSSIGTAQAIIGRLERLPIARRPPMTIRTIQEDIRFMRDNGGGLAEVYVPKRSPDRVDIEVGRRVRTFRLQKEWSQEKLADQLGLTFQQVQKYEKGTNRIGAGRLQRIANILEIPVADFFTSHKQGGVAPA